jgi:hypothetical protein
MSFSIRMYTFPKSPKLRINLQYHPSGFTILHYHPYNLHIITISPISQILRLPSPYSKDHIVPSHVHDNNITIVHDTLLMFWVTVLSPIERLSLIINSISPLLPPLVWVITFCKGSTSSHKLYFDHHVIL